MYLTQLSLTHYRNFSRLDLDVPTGVLMLVGANAQGKTSLLEAIYFLATFTAFHAEHDRQVINFLAAQETATPGLGAVARIVGDFQRGGRKHRLEVRLILEVNGNHEGPRLRKEILLDGVKRKQQEAVGHFNAVLFLPQMLAVIDGSPDERRRYLNTALSQVVPDYVGYLSLYTQTLTQRNALLKQLAERNGDSGQLAYWDEQLASAGAYLIQARIRALLALEKLATGVHRELTRGQEVLRLVYRPSYDPLPQPANQYNLPMETVADRSRLALDQIRDGFLEALARLRGEELVRGVTTIGPHRDEMRFLANGVDLGRYGSRGQVRTAMLAMKLAEVAWMKEQTGQWPVLLLDEVLAELDTDRRADLLGRLAGSEQVWLTTTDLDLFLPDFTAAATCWRVSSGRIISGASA
jgi:DNA replication and repair protein RecF